MFIVTKQIDSTNISRLCRTCLQEDCDKMVYLFVGPAGSSLAAKLRSLSCLDVWQGDGLPERMCDRCVTRTESALLYREQCRAADRALRQAAMKVAGVTPYTTGCKLFQENQTLVPIQNNQNTFKCMECGALFINYQELLAHKKFHLPFYEDNNIPLHVFESHMGYSNFPHQNHGMNYSMNMNNVHQNQSVIISNTSNPMQPNDRSGHLDYPLIDYSLPNKIPTTNDSYTPSSDNIDVSGDEEQIEISDSNIFTRHDDQTCENLIQDLSYSRSTANDYQVIQSLHFSHNTEMAIHETTKSMNHQMDHQMQSQMLSKIGVDKIGEVQDEMLPKPNCSDGKISEMQDLILPKVVEKKFRCEQCSKSFSQKSRLRSHVLTHSDLKPFQCNHCHKAYTLKSKLNAHVRLHTKRNVHRCRICDKEFSYPSYLKEHSKVHELKSGPEPGKNFECTVCQKRFQVEKNLTLHLRLHSGTGVLSCELCDKKFSRKYHLKTHLKTHQAAKTHKCDYCEKCFTLKCNLVEHLRIHTKMKPFRCETCGKCFAQSSHLKSHKTSHENTRLHQCRICGKRFKLSSHLKRHTNLHTGGKVYKCNECGQLFSHSFSLKRHSKKHTESY